MTKSTRPLSLALLLAALPIFPSMAQTEAPFTQETSAETFGKLSYQELRKQITKLKAKKDYAGLETAISELRKQKRTLYDAFNPMATFYTCLVVDDTDNEKLWKGNKAFLDGWLAAYPESIAAQTALMEYWCNYAWQARGGGWASTVTDDGWVKMRERLAEARKIYDAVIEKGNVDDSYFYRKALTIALGQHWSFDAVVDCMLKGRKIDPNYLGLYTSAAYHLAPKWHGEPGDVEKFAALVAGLFRGEDADYVYAETMKNAIDSRRNLADGFFERNPDAYPRMRRGFETGMRLCASAHRRANSASELARFAVIKGDNETAKALFLSWGGSIQSNVFGSPEIKLEMMKQCGAYAELERAIQFEREGKLAEAEALYKSFETDAPKDQSRSDSHLIGFYLRQGMKDAYLASGAKPLADMEKDSLNEVAYGIYVAMMLGEWDAAKVGAERFDAKRPWNLIGRGALFLDAARRGDQAAGEALKVSFLENKTNRPALKNAQAVFRGEKTWLELTPEFRKLDGYSSQAAMVLIGYQLSQGNRQVAREMLEAFTPPDGLGAGALHIDILHSMQYGALKEFFQEPKP